MTLFSPFSSSSAARRVWLLFLTLTGLSVLAAIAVVAYALLVVAPGLPSIDAVIDYRPKMPLRVYSADNVLIGEFGEERRDFVPVAEIPDVMKKAVIAIEDDRFYEHGGIDLVGILRAGVANLRNSRSQGASTITMQVARAFFLTRQKTYGRKLQEMMLALRIEQRLPKDKILELYMNQIYLGERAYGFGSAAQVYFGKPLQKVSIAEAAMLAGLPQAPAAANPIVNLTRATARQQLVLKRMRDLGFITSTQFDVAMAEKLQVRRAGQRFATHAEYAAEMVRQLMFAQYREAIYTSGMSVYTTIQSSDQEAAYRALRRGVLDYDRRHGYRGPEAFIDLPEAEDDRQDAIDDALVAYRGSEDDLQPAVVLKASPRAVSAQLLSGDVIQLSGETLHFGAAFLSPKTDARYRIRPGAILRVTRDGKNRWTLAQLPEVAAAFVSLNAQDGALRTLVGGFDYSLNKFDHVSQAWRQPGSSIKPFVYSAALEKGFSPATLIEDAPLDLPMNDGSGKAWQPQNDDGSVDGPITMRTALKKSKNLVSLRILQSITPSYVKTYLSRFGFDESKQPANLTLALGTGSVTPMQMAAAYAVFANGGYQIAPYLIRKVVDAQGKVVSETLPSQAGDETARVIDARNAYLMDSMMRDVVRSGTAAAAGQKLGRPDLAGKTGTTNDAFDGWFAGYGANIVGVAWMGYDQPKSLGNREFGATVALPIWTEYMRSALRGQAPVERQPPEGLVPVDGDWMYQEYIDGGGVRTLGVPQEPQQAPSFWQKLFGTPPAPPTEEEKEKKRIEDLYRGG